jgi:YcxB-like protein
MLVFAFLAVYLASEVARGNFHWSWNWENLFGPLFFFIIFPYAFFVAPYFSSKKYLERNPNLVGPNTYTFSPDGIDVSGLQSKGHLDWGAVLEARETSTQFLIYPQTSIAHVIPKRFLANAEQQICLRALIRDHAKKSTLQS